MTHVQPSRSDRSPKGVTRQAVAVAALAVCEEEGVEQLSMRRVAGRLGVTPMALYNHVQGKDELVELVADHVRAGVTVADGLPPRDRLVDLLGQLSDVGARYPRVVESGALTDASESSVRLRLAVLRALAELGLAPAEVRTAHNALLLLVSGAAAAQRHASQAALLDRLHGHQSALQDLAGDADRELVEQVAALPATTVADELVRAIDLVLAGSGRSARTSRVRRSGRR